MSSQEMDVPLASASALLGSSSTLAVTKTKKRGGESVRLLRSQMMKHCNFISYAKVVVQLI